MENLYVQITNGYLRATKKQGAVALTNVSVAPLFYKKNTNPGLRKGWDFGKI